MSSAAEPGGSGSRIASAPRRVCDQRGPGRGSPTAPTSVSTAGSRLHDRPRAALPISPALRAQQAREMERRLLPLVDGQLSVAVTDNRAVMISVRRDLRRKVFAVRLHHIFVDAPAPVLRDLARYLALNDASASRRLNRFIDSNDHRIGRPQPGRRARLALRPHGRVHDLQEILDRLDHQYFDGRVRARVTWSHNRARGSARGSIRLGSCHVEARLIRIHPGLDQEWVPRHYLEWVVYHEMLHCVHPVPVVNGRRVFHGEAFARDERRYHGYEQAVAWERRHLAALLCV